MGIRSLDFSVINRSDWWKMGESNPLISGANTKSSPLDSPQGGGYGYSFKSIMQVRLKINHSSINA